MLSSIFNEMAPVFRRYVQAVFHLKLGLCQVQVNLERTTGCPLDGECQLCLALPYCSKKLKWEVLFDAAMPWLAPDFRFDDDSFLSSVDVDFLEEKVPSLAKWNATDPKALSNVLSELISLFRSHQVQKLHEDESSRALFEYRALICNALISESDIEVFVGSHVVEFLIKLNVDTSRLPELFNDEIDENPGIDTALLLVRYSNSTNAELIMSPLLSKSLGNITLPLMHQGGVLMDYVPMVTDLLNSKIQGLVNNEKLKRNLLAQLIVKYEGAVLEHDANNASFLFEMNDFHWILQIDIGIKFPEKPPVLTLRSVYHSTKGKPKSKVLPSCPYNNFEGYIEQQVEIFKNDCKGVPSTSLTLEN